MELGRRRWRGRWDDQGRGQWGRHHDDGGEGVLQAGSERKDSITGIAGDAWLSSFFAAGQTYGHVDDHHDGNDWDDHQHKHFGMGDAWLGAFHGEDGSHLWTVQIGSEKSDTVAAVAATASGSAVFACGQTYFRRAELPLTNRGDAAAATWIFRGGDAAAGTRQFDRDRRAPQVRGSSVRLLHRQGRRVDHESRREDGTDFVDSADRLGKKRRADVFGDHTFRRRRLRRRYARPRRNPISAVAASTEYPRRGRGVAATRLRGRTPRNNT